MEVHNYILDKKPIKEAVFVSNPQASRSYGLPKVHKDVEEIRST